MSVRSKQRTGNPWGVWLIAGMISLWGSLACQADERSLRQPGPTLPTRMRVMEVTPQPAAEKYFTILGDIPRSGVYTDRQDRITLQALVEAAGGIPHSQRPFIRVIRGGEDRFRITYVRETAEQQSLFAGDVVVVQPKPGMATIGERLPVIPIACLGLDQRPVVLPLSPEIRSVHDLLKQLMQEPQLARSLRILDPYARHQTAELVPGTVVIFQSSAVNRASLANIEAFPPAVALRPQDSRLEGATPEPIRTDMTNTPLSGVSIQERPIFSSEQLESKPKSIVPSAVLENSRELPRIHSQQFEPNITRADEPLANRERPLELWEVVELGQQESDVPDRTGLSTVTTRDPQIRTLPVADGEALLRQESGSANAVHNRTDSQLHRSNGSFIANESTSTDSVASSVPPPPLDVPESSQLRTPNSPGTSDKAPTRSIEQATNSTTPAAIRNTAKASGIPAPGSKLSSTAGVSTGEAIPVPKQAEASTGVREPSELMFSLILAALGLVCLGGVACVSNPGVKNWIRHLASWRTTRSSQVEVKVESTPELSENQKIRCVTDILNGKLKVLEERFTLPRMIDFHGEPIGPARITLHERHEQLAGPHFQKRPPQGTGETNADKTQATLQRTPGRAFSTIASGSMTSESDTEIGEQSHRVDQPHAIRTSVVSQNESVDISTVGGPESSEVSETDLTDESKPDLHDVAEHQALPSDEESLAASAQPHSDSPTSAATPEWPSEGQQQDRNFEDPPIGIVLEAHESEAELDVVLPPVRELREASAGQGGALQRVLQILEREKRT